VKTTLNIDDALYRRAKVRAAEDGRTVSELVEEGLHLALMGKSQPVPSHRRAPLPWIEGGHPASLDQEMTAEKTAEILLAQETIWAQESR
jgi:plasmid stability protein